MSRLSQSQHHWCYVLSVTLPRPASPGNHPFFVVVLCLVFEHFVFAFVIVFVFDKDFVFKWTIVDSNTQISFIHFLIV